MHRQNETRTGRMSAGLGVKRSLATLTRTEVRLEWM